MNKIAILHFSPLELYPPVQNFIEVFGKTNPTQSLYIFTTTSITKELDKFTATASGTRIIRLGKSGQHITSYQRIQTYLLFYLGSFLYLLWLQPSRVLYYETISSFPVYLYRRFINKKVAVFIHYHEYTTPGEFEKGMMLTKWFHRLEKWLYPIAKWVSHTNLFRMQMFEKDISPVTITNPQVVPNYPPKSWYQPANDMKAMPLKIVYAGSLSMDTMYTGSFAKWVVAQNGKVIWHIYAYNISNEAKTYLQSLQTNFIELKEGVNYRALPQILTQYQVGVILYMGHIPNYMYNAPNKLFEYLACGLDVWYPDIMTGIHAYDTNKTFPKVMPLNFNNLHNFDLDTVVSREGYTFHNPKFFCEDALALLVERFGEAV